MSSGSKNVPRYTCLSEAKAPHSQRMWAEVSSSASNPFLRHCGTQYRQLTSGNLLLLQIQNAQIYSTNYKGIQPLILSRLLISLVMCRLRNA